MVRKDQKGFAYVELALIGVAALIVLGTAWYVINSKNSSESILDKAAQDKFASSKKRSSSSTPSSSNTGGSSKKDGSSPTQPQPPTPPPSTFTKCKNFSSTDSDITATSLSDLKGGIIGTWTGCVTTPWVPKYDATVTFRADGAYSATSDEYVALYYGGSNNDDPRKIYSIDDISSIKMGYGSIDVVFLDGSGSVTHDKLSDIALMGNKLSFKITHLNQYGPLVFQLNRN